MMVPLAAIGVHGVATEQRHSTVWFVKTTENGGQRFTLSEGHAKQSHRGFQSKLIRPVRRRHCAKLNRNFLGLIEQLTLLGESELAAACHLVSPGLTS